MEVSKEVIVFPEKRSFQFSKIFTFEKNVSRINIPEPFHPRRGYKPSFLSPPDETRGKKMCSAYTTRGVIIVFVFFFFLPPFFVNCCLSKR